MKKGKKSGNLRGVSPESTAKRNLSSNMTGSCPSHARSAGSGAGESARPLNILLYDSCYTCPLSVYIDVTVDDRLERLIIGGNPSREMLEETKMKLTAEFAELSGNEEAKIFNDVLDSYYKQRGLILGLETSLKLVTSGHFEAAITYLNSNGVKCSVPENEGEISALIARIQSKLKNRLAKFKEISSQYESLSKKGNKPTRRYYNKLLIILSTCEVIKIQLNPQKMTVAEFAEYLNMFNEYQNQLKNRQRWQTRK
jgi:hypothetical protein